MKSHNLVYIHGFSSTRTDVTKQTGQRQSARDSRCVQVYDLTILENSESVINPLKYGCDGCDITQISACYSDAQYVEMKPSCQQIKEVYNEI